MSIAAETRESVRRHPFLLAALRADVVNYTAAARFLDIGETEAVAAALRRYAATLDDRETDERPVSVTMESGLGKCDADEHALLAVGGAGLAPDGDSRERSERESRQRSSAGGSLTGVLATGDVDAAALAAVLGRLSAADVHVEAAGVAGDALLVAVERREGASALRHVEDALAAVPERGGP